MATLSTGARNAACNGIVDLLDIGSGDATGDIRIGTAGMALQLALLTFANPAFGAAATGVATAGTIASDTNTVAGTAAEFQARDRDNALVFSGSVGAGSGDINLNSVTFTTGGTCAISSFTVTVPAS